MLWHWPAIRPNFASFMLIPYQPQNIKVEEEYSSEDHSQGYCGNRGIVEHRLRTEVGQNVMHDDSHLCSHTEFTNVCIFPFRRMLWVKGRWSWQSWHKTQTRIKHRWESSLVTCCFIPPCLRLQPTIDHDPTATFIFTARPHLHRVIFVTKRTYLDVYFALIIRA